MKIVVTGDRDWDDIETVVEALSQHVSQDVLLIEGECRGGDLICRAVAEELGFKIDPNPAMWRDGAGNFRKWAGPERNQQMLDKHPDIDVCYAFHNNIFGSKGTKDMLTRVIAARLPRKLWSTPRTSITSFSNEHRYLSNFFPVDVTFEGVLYHSTEHAYQAAKTLDPTERKAIQQAKTPTQAKHVGYKITKRKDWNDVKASVMHALLRLKFSQDVFSDALLATRNAELVETNTWNDEYWGVCNGIGENMLGKLLMQTRNELCL